MRNWQYTQGLHELGNGMFAYLQPQGSWGWSNAGLIVDGETSLLIDTLFDLRLTQEMLDSMRRAIPASVQIDTVVNTHADGDHCYGNQLVTGAQIITSARTAEEMLDLPPEIYQMSIEQAPVLGKIGEFILQAFGPFQFDGIRTRLPDKTFEGQLNLKVGNKRVELIEVGPAHTRGDTLVYLPDQRVIFTGDILFIGGHPVMWEGPVGNWIRACERILALDIDTIVPGHGPITDKQGVLAVKSYLEYVYQEASARYKAGMPAFEAARDIPLDKYATWQNGERIAVNVASIYRELSGEQEKPNKMLLIGQMAALIKS